MWDFCKGSTQSIGMASVLLCVLLSLWAVDGAPVCTACGPAKTDDLRVAAFNIKVLGRAKMRKPGIVDKLVQILTKYDLVLIQEIRDITQTAIYKLLDEVNAANNTDPFNMELSTRLGRTSAKEQYAYLYRCNKLQVMQTYQWPDKTDIFEREPFIAHFRAPGHRVGDFGFIGIHVKPTDAVTENDALVDVYDGMQSLWGLQNFIIGGDLNAGCSYVSKSRFADIRLWNDERFEVVIDHDVDTSIATRDCPYDRLILAGSYLKINYVNQSAQTYRFDEETGLDETGFQARDVSDHVPVELRLR